MLTFCQASMFFLGVNNNFSPHAYFKYTCREIVDHIGGLEQSSLSLSKVGCFNQNVMAVDCLIQNVMAVLNI